MLESNPLGKKPVKSGIEGVVSCAGEVVLQKAAEFESWRAKKRAEELAIKDNPKIAKELLKRTESIKKEFDRAWERQRKINKKNGGNDWASSAEVSIGEPLISKMNDLLKDYQLFNSTEKYPHASSLGKEFIEHFLSRHDFNHALAVWKFMPDGEWDLGEKILEIMYRNIYDGSEVRYRERIAQGMSVEESQKIRSAYCDKLVASIPEQIEAHPDLSAMNTIGIRYRGSGGSIENRHKAFHRLLSSEEHQSFLKYFSPLSPELQATISPEERVKLFNIFLEKDFNSIVKSFDFFKEDFENLSSERRAEVFGIIGEAINDSLPDYGDGRGSSGIYQIKNAKVDFATFLEHVRISEVDKNNIRGALTPYDFLLRIRNSSNETKPLHLKTEELLFKYNNFILDIARYYPKALILNGGTLLGYANKLNSEPTADDFIENLIVKKKNFVIYELIKNWMHGDGSGSHEEPRFTTDQIVKLGRYIIDEDLPEGIAILSKDPWYIFQISGDMGIALVHHSMKTNNFENIAIFARNLDIISNFDKIFAVELVQHILTGNIQVGIDELASNIHEVANIDANLGAEVVRQLVITNNTDGIYRLLRKIKTIFDFDAQVAKELIEHVLVDEDQNKIYILIEQIGVIASCNADLAIQIVRYVVANQNSEFLINFSKNLSSIPDLVIDSQLQSQIATAFMEYPVAISNMLNCKNNSFSFSRLPMELQEKIGALAIRDGNEKIFIQLVSKNVPLLDASVELGPTISAIRDYNERTKILHSPTARKYVELHLNQGREIADSYIDDLEKNASRLVTKEIPLEERKLPEYRYLVEYVFPAGNYSTHEKNLACGDKLEHLAGYDFQKEGYPVTLTGLLGYRLREGESEDRTLLAQYQQRLKSIREFVASRGPDNKLLQEAFDKKVDDFFERYADSNFQSIPDLSTKEKMIVLFVTEALRKEREVDFSPNQQVLDLIVEYKYAYHENLEAYIQHSASDVAQYKDETSQRFLLLQELSNIYGENVKHVLRHNIFEDIAENGKHYNTIVEAFGSALSESSESFEMTPREYQSVENIFNKKLPFEESRRLVIEKLADLYGPQDKSKDDEEKKRVYESDRSEFIKRLQDILPSALSELSSGIVSERLAGAFSIHPKHSRRFENTFDNPQIPEDAKFKVLVKQVIDIFGSNIKFGNDEERENFEQSVSSILEPVRIRFDKNLFFELVPKLRTLRSQYRFGINRKLEELFSLDLSAINREIGKFEEVSEVEAKETRMGGAKENIVKKSSKGRPVRTFITKTQETTNARMGAYLCIAGDESMWKNPNYFEAVDKNEETGKCVGLTMYLRIDAPLGKKYLWIGPNPFESFLTQVSAEKALDHQYKVAVDFASRNGFDGVVVPAEEGQILGGCTNRGGNFPDLIKAKRIRNKKGELEIVDFGKEHKLGGGYGYSKGALVWQK